MQHINKKQKTVHNVATLTGRRTPENDRILVKLDVVTIPTLLWDEAANDFVWAGKDEERLRVKLTIWPSYQLYDPTRRALVNVFDAIAK